MFKEESSFSEEKEAKRLFPFAAPSIVAPLAPAVARAKGIKFFLLLFCSQKRRIP
jgi:hypothetical protein